MSAPAAPSTTLSMGHDGTYETMIQYASVLQCTLTEKPRPVVQIGFQTPVGSACSVRELGGDMLGYWLLRKGRFSENVLSDNKCIQCYAVYQYVNMYLWLSVCIYLYIYIHVLYEWIYVFGFVGLMSNGWQHGRLPAAELVELAFHMVGQYHNISYQSNVSNIFSKKQ